MADSSRFGYRADPSTADPEKLLKAKNKTHIAEPPEDVPAFPSVYFDKTLDLARQNDTQVVFLDLPAYGAFYAQPAHLDWYQKRGSVWLPPKRSWTIRPIGSIMPT